MKTGITLDELDIELERQTANRRDFLIDTPNLMVVPAEAVQQQNAAELSMLIKTNGTVTPMPITDHALGQIGYRLNIPRKFVKRLAGNHPDLLAYNLNKLFRREPQTRMVRTLDNTARAYLSDRYRPMDNLDLVKAVRPALDKHGANIVSCQITDKKVYLKAVIEGLKAEIPPPAGAVMGRGHTIYTDSVQAAIIISNSEIGCGRLSVSPGVFTERCTNLAAMGDRGMSKVHLGTKHSKGEGAVWEMLTDETKKLSDDALWAQIRDISVKALDGTIFNENVKMLTDAREQKIETRADKTVDLFGKEKALTEEEKSGILDKLITNGDLSKYGLSNAVTEYSAEVDSYDRASDLESLGGSIIEMKETEFGRYAKAA